METDVLVIGAGPAGSAAAAVLARAGLRVVLADQKAFPRDKVCGDALIPDALAALERLGLLPAVAARARFVERLRAYAPDRSHVDVPARMACLPRLQLDALLNETALAAGAESLAHHRLEAAVEEGGRVRGARLQNQARGTDREIRARYVVLATGAAAEPLDRFGVCRRREASGVAARVYVQVDDATAREIDHLLLCFDRRILPGYGWIFPGPDNVFNVGVGLFHEGRRPPTVRNVRELWQDFVIRFAPAGHLVSAGRALTRLAGAPLRTALVGSDLARPGLLVAGEAAGTTYSFSGEGIGKAMASAMLAAECILEAERGAEAPETTYPARLRAAYAARFDAYRTAQRWLSHPWLCNLLARRARRGGFVAQQLAALLAESDDPRALFSRRGLVRALLG